MAKLKGTFEQRVISKLEKAGVPYEYEPHSLSYKVERQYIPDLLVNGRLYVELKGFFRQDSQRKMKAVKSQHPTLDIRFLFQRASSPVHGAKKRKDGTKMTCAEWAERYGFEWAEGEEIPTEWLNE
jgi:uncharacterized protein YueI